MKLLLTPREKDVVDAIKNGETNEEAAEKLFVTKKTIKFHLTNIYKKYQVKNRTGLIAKVFSTELPHANDN